MNKLFLLTLVAVPVGLCAMDSLKEVADSSPSRSLASATPEEVKRQLLLGPVNGGDPAIMCRAAQRLMGSQEEAAREEYVATLFVAAEAVSPAGDTQAAHALAQWMTNYEGTFFNKTARLAYANRVHARQIGTDPLRGPLKRLVLDSQAQVPAVEYERLGNAFRGEGGLEPDYLGALTVYTLGAARLPTDPRFPHKLSCIFVRDALPLAAQIPRALSWGTRALGIAPQLPCLLANVGILHRLLGDDAKALKFYKEALAQDRLAGDGRLDRDMRKILRGRVSELEPSCVIL